MKRVLLCLVVVLASCSNEPGTKNNNSLDQGPADGGARDMQGASDAGEQPDGVSAPDSAMNDPDMAVPSDLAMPPDMRRDEDMGVTMLPPGVCGNEIVETGETCDDCADLDCDDGNACTVDFVAGDASLCAAYCRNDAVVHCESGDGCCGAGCTSDDDDDCSSTCGDDVVDALETCDGDCPTDCDDMDPSTRDVLLGSAANCNVECVHHPILRCIDGDGYCPAGCLAATDNDCEAECGNGVIEPGETCDPPGSCPSCDDGNACTSDETSGSAATCDVVCTSTPILTCTDGDGCCGAQCSFDEDNDCSPTCGDNQVQPPETCERPPECNAIVCNALACETAVRTGHHRSCNIECGYVPTTGCNDNDGCCTNGCTAATDNDCNAVCGNGVLEPGEICDPPGTCEIACPDDSNACTTVELVGDPSTCDAQCVTSPVTTCGLEDDCCPAGCNANNDPDCDPFCGNDVVEDGETCDGNCSCDDMNECTTDTRIGLPSQCDVMCENTLITFCGNDDGCCPSGVGCNSLLDSDCAPVCGNGLLEDGEVCDGNCPTSCGDGNACTADVLTGDASTCDAVCSNPTITTCGNAEGCCPSTCNANTDPDCSPECGNGVVESPEVCDGNCPANCNDQDACTIDSQSGDPSTCDIVCSYTTITTCTGGDGCCPSNCTNLNDSDCPI